MFHDNCDCAKNLASSTHVRDECAVVCMVLVIEEKNALMLFGSVIVVAEDKGGVILGYGMGGCRKAKLIANTISVGRSCL